MTMSININDVTDIELAGIDHRDLPDLCDTYVASAVWKHNGEELTEDELEKLQSSNDMRLHEMAYLQATGG